VVRVAAGGSVSHAVISELDFRGTAAHPVDRWIRLALLSRDLDCFPHRELFFCQLCVLYCWVYFSVVKFVRCLIIRAYLYLVGRLFKR